MKKVSRIIKKVLRAIACLLPCLLPCFLITLPVSAIDYESVGQLTVNSCDAYFDNGSSNHGMNYNPSSTGCTIDLNPTMSRWVTSVKLSLSSRVPANSLFIVSGRFVENSPNPLNFIELYPNVDLQLISSSHTKIDNLPQVQFTNVYYTPNGGSVFNFDGGYIAYAYHSTSATSAFYFSSVNYVTLTNEPTREQINNLIQQFQWSREQNSDIHESINGVIRAIQALDLNVDMSQLAENQQATTDAVNAQTEQQQSQYEQEKQEESQREQQQEASSESSQSVFSNISIFNPFEAIFHLPDSCPKSIPIISGFLNRSDSSLACFFPESVRNVVTPVLSISTTMLLFGFAVRWLNKSDEVAV